MAEWLDVQRRGSTERKSKNAPITRFDLASVRCVELLTLCGEKNFRASNGENTLVFKQEYRKCRSSVRFSNPALHLPQQCCFFKFNAAFAPAVLLFQIQRCKRGKNIDSLRIRDSTQMAFSLRVSIPAVEE